MSAESAQKMIAPGAAEALRSGKGGGDENFPVASLLIAPRHRPVILAFYDFVRAADDVADHPSLTPEQKLALLDQLDQSLTGEGDAEPLGVRLRKQLAERGLTDRHARDLLEAFRVDARKSRYDSWRELLAYCRLSAMPVGRFLLDVHGESRDLWPASDAICAALQINNHLQDCGKDYASLDRVYIPLDALADAGARVEDLGAARARPALRACLRGLAARNRALLDRGVGLPGRIADARLGMEIAVVVGHAYAIADLLIARDPLSETVKLSKGQMLSGTVRAAAGEGFSRLRSRLGMGAPRDEAVDPARERARKSSFYRAMAILPREKRDAMFEIYSFCRAVDDIADEGGDKPTRRAGLDQWRRDIDALYDGGEPGLAAGLAAPLRRYGFLREDFLAVIDGMQMDVDADIVAPDLATLDLYCDRVASAVGRLSVRVFGLPEDAGVDLAYHLGRALQLTNILRDIDEDASIGRVYLPRDYFDAAGVKDVTPESILALPDLHGVCAPLLWKAKAHFERADEIMDRQPRENIRAPKIMSLAYGAIWSRLAERGFARPRKKISTPKLVLLRAILDYGFL